MKTEQAFERAPRGRRRPQRFLGGAVVAVVVGCVLVACSPDPTPATTAQVPLQGGKQTTLVEDALGYTAISTDAKNVLYLGGAVGIAMLAPGATKPVALKLNGHPTVMTLAAAPDGALYFVTQEGVVETLAPASTTSDPLPFDRLAQFGQIAVARDGTVYLGDDDKNKLLTLAPGAAAPTELPVSGVEGPGHMVIDAQGTLYVYASGKVVKIEKDATTGVPVDGVTDHVGGLAIDAAGNLYATDIQARTVSRMPAGGGDWTQLPFSGLQSPTDITVDGDGNVYVVDQRRRIVELAAR